MIAEEKGVENAKIDSVIVNIRHFMSKEVSSIGLGSNQLNLTKKPIM